LREPSLACRRRTEGIARAPGRRSTTRTRSDGTTSTTAAVGTRRSRRRFDRTSSTDGSNGSPSARTRSTVPWASPCSEKPTQLASQYRVTGLEAANRLLWRSATAIAFR
jgi:hypothetical protein